MQPHLAGDKKDRQAIHTEHQCQAKEQAVAVAVAPAAAAAVPPLEYHPAVQVSNFAAVFHIVNRLALGYLARSSVSFASCMKHTLERRDPGLAACWHQAGVAWRCPYPALTKNEGYVD